MILLAFIQNSKPGKLMIVPQALINLINCKTHYLILMGFYMLQNELTGNFCIPNIHLKIQ